MFSKGCRLCDGMDDVGVRGDCRYLLKPKVWKDSDILELLLSTCFPSDDIKNKTFTFANMHTEQNNEG